ncbi:MAG: 2-oxoacid:ferredoxin oxidoreductase subunit beta [Deltaproteobacteria bacterium]|nr:2-oxoacid:ferredoxin oxidoreductase subunit beta [Deltaproteobacteria bacterium]
MTSTATTDTPVKLTKKDFDAGIDVRWCPGCGDFAILAAVQRTLPELPYKKEDYVFVSGIGCSSRFPYYMATYGFHTIHGRAPAIAMGVKATRPELSVWVATGDGDALSIGGNHFIHTLRRNPDINILLFNNRIYGLTKGQYSPTSETGKKTKSSPLGSIDHPFNPVSVALGAEGTFIARVVDRDAKHVSEILKAAALHKGTSFMEIYQNCLIFNDGAYNHMTERSVKAENVLYLEEGKPLLFGEKNEKGIVLDELGQPKAVRVEDVGIDAILKHDPKSPDPSYAFMLSRMGLDGVLPTPVGIFRAVERPTYEDMLHKQIADAKPDGKKADLHDLLTSGSSWTIS